MTKHSISHFLSIFSNLSTFIQIFGGTVVETPNVTLRITKGKKYLIEYVNIYCLRGDI